MGVLLLRRNCARGVDSGCGGLERRLVHGCGVKQADSRIRLQSSRAEAWGSGKPYCEALAQEGAAVVVADIDGHAAQQVADGMRLGAAPARSAQIGVSKPEDVASLVGTFRAPRYLVREPAPCFPVRFRPKGGCLNARTSPFSGFAFGFQPRIEPVEIDHHSV
jgi:hypothetical protein